MILVLYFASNAWERVPCVQGAKPAAPPTTSSLVWARRRGGAATGAVAAPAAARIVRRFKVLALGFVICGSPSLKPRKQGPCLERVSRRTSKLSSRAQRGTFNRHCEGSLAALGMTVSFSLLALCP